MNNPENEIVVIVDGADTVVDAMPRAMMRANGVLHRTTYLLVFSSKGELLVQTRTATKDIFPGLLDFAAGGVVLAGETYPQSAERELHEELGIAVPLQYAFELYFEDIHSLPRNRNWGRVYTCVCDGPFTLQKEEVASAQFMGTGAALNMDPSRVTPDTRQVLLHYLM
ncbi:MAG: NUDIX domain-containing protein [Gammaproteobacteria bacterium]|nr:NUDIX domain-containing protein [Gammaproteobacteria bacterium]